MGRIQNLGFKTDFGKNPNRCGDVLKNPALTHEQDKLMREGCAFLGLSKPTNFYAALNTLRSGCSEPAVRRRFGGQENA
jgi:hypothetical protein